jgi:hypothetical protein
VKLTDAKQQSAVKLSANAQRYFLILIVCSWISTIVMSLVFMIGSPNVTKQMWCYVGAQILIPLVYAAIAFIYTSRHYRALLHSFFVASFLALMGLLMYGVLLTVDNIWRIKFGGSSALSSSGFWGQFGHELSVGVVSLLFYVAAIGLHERKLSRK